MEIEAMKKQTIERLKAVKREQELSISNIMDMLSTKGYYISEPTLKKYFPITQIPLILNTGILSLLLLMFSSTYTVKKLKTIQIE